MVNLATIVTTERGNADTYNLDTMTTQQALEAMNAEDQKVAPAVRVAIPQIAQAVDLVVAAIGGGGRLIYLGAGTSGRLGVLDAVECPPTFGTSPETVVGLIAGGPGAFLKAVEGAEDSPTLARDELAALDVSPRDVVIGIAASGRTPYVIGGLDYARELGVPTVSIACNPHAAVSEHADVAIEVDNGPELLTGSTRLKSGTSQKLILNMISTISMVRLGKVYHNLMVDVRPTNEKLVARAIGIVRTVTGCGEDEARSALEAAGNSAKTAIVMVALGIDAEAARDRLDQAGGFVRTAIGEQDSSDIH